MRKSRGHTMPRGEKTQPIIRGDDFIPFFIFLFTYL
jgi:hypothetical protein